MDAKQEKKQAFAIGAAAGCLAVAVDAMNRAITIAEAAPEALFTVSEMTEMRGIARRIGDATAAFDRALKI